MNQFVEINETLNKIETETYYQAAEIVLDSISDSENTMTSMGLWSMYGAFIAVAALAALILFIALNSVLMSYIADINSDGDSKETCNSEDDENRTPAKSTVQLSEQFKKEENEESIFVSNQSEKDKLYTEMDDDNHTDISINEDETFNKAGRFTNIEL